MLRSTSLHLLAGSLAHERPGEQAASRKQSAVTDPASLGFGVAVRFEGDSDDPAEAGCASTRPFW